MLNNSAVIDSNVEAINQPSHSLPSMEKEFKKIKTLISCLETAQQTIALMEKHSKKLMTKLNKDRVNQLISLH